MPQPQEQPHSYLPRLDPVFYQGDAVVHWTTTMEDRSKGWLTPAFHFFFRETVLHALVRYSLICPAYTLMPDHFHLLLMGLQRESNQLTAISFIRTSLKPQLAPHLPQRQAYDHVLRDEERQAGALMRLVSYLLNNPVRAGLVQRVDEWPFCGALLLGYPRLSPWTEEFWPLFWRLYQERLAPGAREITRPYRLSKPKQKGK